MEQKTNENGVTLIALAVTIIVLVILASITISASIPSNKSAQSSVKYSEVQMIQHAILENYAKKQITNNDDFVGIKLNTGGTSEDKNSIEYLKKIIDNINSETDESISLKDKSADPTYYRLNQSDLKKIGVKSNEADTYIVNYRTGEVLNESKPVTDDEVVLYVWAKEVDD